MTAAEQERQRCVMNRHRRRSEIANFKRKVSHASIVTFLVDAGDLLEGHPLLRDASRWWRANVKRRRPTCCACRASFADDGVSVGAFLFSTSPAAPLSASVSAFCGRCWRTMTDEQIEQAAMKTLRKLMPDGTKFEDAS